jgi:hypothetical protein
VSQLPKSVRRVIDRTARAAYEKGRDDERTALLSGMFQGLNGDGERVLTKALAGLIHKAWSEGDHPRGDDGRFVSGEDLSAAKSDPAKLRERVTDPEQRKKLDAAIGGGGGDADESAAGTHDLFLPKNRKGLNLDTAEAALGQMGYELNKSSQYDFATKRTLYTVTYPNGRKRDLTSQQVAEIVYGGAKGGDPSKRKKAPKPEATGGGTEAKDAAPAKGAEAEAPAPGKTRSGTVGEAHQMRLADFLKTQAGVGADGATLEAFRGVHRSAVEASVRAGKTIDPKVLGDHPGLVRQIEQEKEKHPHEYSRSEYLSGYDPEVHPRGQQFAAEHRSAVEQAIKAGKAVSPKVLADYPDLAPAIRTEAEAPKAAGAADPSVPAEMPSVAGGGQPPPGGAGGETARCRATPAGRGGRVRRRQAPDRQPRRGAADQQTRPIRRGGEGGSCRLETGHYRDGRRQPEAAGLRCPGPVPGDRETF